MAGAIYKAEFVVTEQPLADNPHKEASSTTKNASDNALAGNNQSLGAVAKKLLPKLSVAMAVSTAFKAGSFIYHMVNTQQANSALISGDTVAYKHLQNENTIVSNIIGIASAITTSTLSGLLMGGPVGAAIGFGVGIVSQGIQQLTKIPEYQEKVKVFNELAGVERIVSNLDRERFGVNAKTYR